MTPRFWIAVALASAAIIVANLWYIDAAPEQAAPAASSTVAVVETQKQVETISLAATATATTAASEKPKAANARTTVKKTQAALPPPLPPQPTQSEFDATAAVLRSALVNILCLTGRRDIPSISGSGVIIDPRGVILTNAHIAQYFLYLGDPSLNVSCSVRVGGPAQNAYYARVVFISPSWVNANANILSEQNPTGNGESDFAFLAVSGSASNTPLPATFPFIALSQSEAYAGEPVVIGSYAAQFLSSSEIQSSLYPTIVFGSIKAIFTFVETSIDVITLGGSAAAQEGSSGGGVARAPGVIEGIITTSTTEGDTASRTLGGITASYIRRTVETASGMALSDLLAKSPIAAADDFAPQIAGLRSILTASLSH